MTKDTEALREAVEQVKQLAQRDMARTQTDFLGRMGQELCDFEAAIEPYPDGELPDDVRGDAYDAISGLAGLAFAQMLMLRGCDHTIFATPTTTPDTIGSHFGNGGGLDPVAGDVIIGNFIAQYDEGAAGCLMDADDAQSLAREFKRMQGLIYCPGVLRCAKCDFRLIKTILTPAGAFANEEPDSCPNCDAPMWRVTWQDEAKDAYKTAESQMNRALEAERALVAHPPHPAPVDPVETLAQRQAREVMRPQSGSALAQPPFGQVYGMATKPVDPVAGGEALREVVRDALASELGDTYDCGRVWEAWSVGTMGEDDFTPVNDRVDEIADAILAALKGPAA